MKFIFDFNGDTVNVDHVLYIRVERVDEEEFDVVAEMWDGEVVVLYVGSDDTAARKYLNDLVYSLNVEG